MQNNDGNLINEIREIAVQAGSIILKHYKEPLEVKNKPGLMPVTIADEKANDFIVQKLHLLTPDIPVVSEENVAKGIIPDLDTQFWLVDPLDGTKEFIKHNSDFTVNIALIRNRIPVLSVVHVPALGVSYYAEGVNKAFFQEIDQEPQAIQVRKQPGSGVVVVTSRSHRGDEVNEFLEKYPEHQETSRGSSLKFCIVATGEADLYPRFGRTMEWDTAAGHAVVLAAGGKVLDLDGKGLLYGKTDFANPYFIASGLA